MKTINYGTLQVSEIRASQRNTANTVVKTQQEIVTEYTGNSKNFSLANMLGLSKPIVYRNVRKNTQVIPNCSVETVKDALKTVNLSQARIILKEHTTPQWEGHTANAFTNLYYTTELDLTGVQTDAATKTEEHIEAEATPVVAVKAE